MILLEIKLILVTSKTYQSFEVKKKNHEMENISIQYRKYIHKITPSQ